MTCSIAGSGCKQDLEELVKDKPERVLPGDKLAVIEEYAGGGGTYEKLGEVRSLYAGVAEYDRANREVRVKGEGLRSPFPTSGSIVKGVVEAQQGSGVHVRIYSVNDLDVDSNLMGMLRTRGRSSSPCKPGDLVTARVSSTANGMIFLSFSGSGLGVLKTWCSICGGVMEPLSGNRAKCTTCGNLEYRKMAGFEEEHEFEERPRRFFRRGRRGDERGGKRVYGGRQRRDYGRPRRRYE